ncbi:MAG TPA: adenylosuccinate synthase [Thermoanaerobaculia bacterium]|nr:adenylosuccinate synthase [Thermoanaerobaculia bacterium]
MLVSATGMNNSGKNLAVIGAQWGDEGKGKIVDLLCESFDVVARYQGGHNAGHTVKFADKHFSLQLIPSGILHPGKLCVLGNGMVIDPQALLTEIKRLQDAGVVITDNLKISESAHCILPFHKALDLAREEAAGESKIGTTGRGIGPAYEMKVSRFGILVGDLLDREVLKRKIEFACAEKNSVLVHVYNKEAFDPQKLVEEYFELGQILKDRIVDATVLVNGSIRDGKSVMFEGAQGTLLDIDHGTYPYVTSSNTVVGGICTGLGVPPKHIHNVLAVAKAYTTRVGGGPFPTEQLNAVGEQIRKRGNEFGTVTGRPRRIGWLDLNILRTAVMLNGVDEIALTKLDVLDDFDEIPVCTGYRINGKLTTTFPSAAANIASVDLEYTTMRGWKTSTIGAASFEDLPPAARDYVRFVEEHTDTPVAIVSTGPRREETIIRGSRILR